MVKYFLQFFHPLFNIKKKAWRSEFQKLNINLPCKYGRSLHINSPNIKSRSKAPTKVNGIHKTPRRRSEIAKFNKKRFVIVLILLFCTWKRNYSSISRYKLFFQDAILRGNLIMDVPFKEIHIALTRKQFSLKTINLKAPHIFNQAS